jgi:hypothetical protein
MTKPKQIYFAFVLVCVLLTMAAAQERPSVVAQGPSLTITVAATDERVRITAPSSVVQMHVEVYAATGGKLFDQEIRGGNIFDWHLQDGQAQRLVPGTYVCVVTAKSINGKLTQKIGAVSVAEKSVSVQPAESQLLSAAQAQYIGPVEENSSWTIVRQDERQTPTVIAHDGTDGQMIRGRGALTFRIGNFFSGIDTEQMRLTEAGNLGIGTAEPKSKLDVAGTIRAERFLMVRPSSSGSDPNNAAQVSDSSGSIQPLIAGTGTQDRIAKWTDNAGTLGDSGIIETGGLVGIGTTAPDSKLVVSSNSATLPPAVSIARFAAADGVQTAVFADAFGTNPLFNVRRANGTAASPSALQANQLLGVIGASGYGASAYMGTRARVGFFASENWTNTANGTYLTFNTTGNGTATAGGAERLRIDNAGNVGIGTTTPGSKLDVGGDINTSTQFNLGGVRILSAPGLNVYVGANTAVSSGGVSNSLFGESAGKFNATGSFNSFFGAAAGSNNAMGDNNSFFGRAAGLANTTGSNNTVIGFDGNVGANNLDHATAIGANAIVSSSNTIALGRADGSDIVDVPGKLQIDTMAATGGQALCWNSSNRVALCMASSLRYKTQIHSFLGGLDIVRRLRPITFTWKEDGARDLGLGAEEVARVEPLLTFRNKRGEIEGVKYNQVSAVLINAVKEQQQQIQELQRQLVSLKSRIGKYHRHAVPRR